MSKIVQYSTIGALMAGYFRGDCDTTQFNHPHAFGLGCSAGINGELTIFQGTIWEATAGEAIHPLKHHEVPFIQITDFQPESELRVTNINHSNAADILSEHIDINNIFLAVSLQATFENIRIRRPQPAVSEDRDINAFAETQQEYSLNNIKGRLIGFWTPALFGRVSVPGFHFHFIDALQCNSGHVLAFQASEGLLSYQQKPTIEITMPQSEEYKKLSIDISGLDKTISQVEQ